MTVLSMVIMLQLKDADHVILMLILIKPHRGKLMSHSITIIRLRQMQIHDGI